MAVVANFLTLKICPGDYGNHGELRLSTPSPYVVLRSPRFVHGGRNRDCRGRRGHSVNVALTNSLSEYVEFWLKRDNITCMSIIQIYTNSWLTDDGMTEKTPTCVLFDKNKKFSSFGYEVNTRPDKNDKESYLT